MKVFIAGNDRSSDYERELSRRALDRKEDLEASGRDMLASCLERQEHILTLRDCSCERDFLKELFWLMQASPQVNTAPFSVPGHSGFIGRLLILARKALWRVFKYQHDRMAFQQNAINLQVTSSLRYLETLHAGEMESLEERVAELAERVNALEKKGQSNG